MRHDTMDIDELAASRCLGLIPSEDVPGVCLAFVEDYLESGQIVVLASYKAGGLSSEETDELLARGLAELGKTWPDRRAAAMLLARRTAEAAIGGHLSLQDAAFRIAREILPAVRDLANDQEFVGDAFGFEAICGIEDDYDELSQGAQYFEAEVDVDARRIFAEFLAKSHAA